MLAVLVRFPCFQPRGQEMANVCNFCLENDLSESLILENCRYMF